MSHVLRCRITAHHNADRPYDGTSKDFARVLAEHEATVAALIATGADILMADTRPVNVRKVVITEPLIPDTKPDVLINPKADPLEEMAIPGFLARKK